MKKRLIITLALCPIFAWALFGLLGRPVSARIAASHGPRILAIGAGKFSNAERFVLLRMKDCAVLATAGCALVLAWMFTGAFLRRFVSQRAQWALQGIAGFVYLNCFAVIAGHTVLFWCALFTGTGQTHNYTQYQIKQGLMKEIEAPSQAVLLGNSQTRAEIDEGLLNNRLGARVWTTELHFPGSGAYDMILNLERLPAVKIGYIICYLSEGYFYTGIDSDGLMFFFGFRDLPEYSRLRPPGDGLGRNAMLGLLGDALPLFRYREPICGRLLGFRAQNIGQERYNQGLNQSLEQRAKAIAPGFRITAVTTFQKRAFLEFARKCRERQSRLIVCCGQNNPILGRLIDPSVTKDMRAFLQDCAQKDANIVLLDEDSLPVQTSADYEDLTHVNEAAQVRFSKYIAEILDNLARQSKPLTQVPPGT